MSEHHPLPKDVLPAERLQKLQVSLNTLDKENNGVTYDALKKLLTECMVKIDDATITRLVGTSLSERDGRFSRAEVVRYVGVCFADCFHYGTELRKCSRRGLDKELVELISRGCDVADHDGHGRTCLHHAAEFGLAGTLKTIVDAVGGKSKITIDVREHGGWTPLMNAAANGHRDAAKYLRTAGADIKARSTCGRTSLHW